MTLPIEWAAAGVPFPGELLSGDAHVVLPAPGGVLLGLIYGAGHGPEAARASKEAVRVLEENPGLALDELVRRCHEALLPTRGAVLSLASLAPGALTWLGVGNVEGVVVRAGSGRRESLLLKGGIVGHALPSLRPATLPLATGDLVVLASDGVRTRFAADLVAGEPPARASRRIVEQHGRGTDDVLVLAARWLGGSNPHDPSSSVAGSSTVKTDP